MKTRTIFRLSDHLQSNKIDRKKFLAIFCLFSLVLSPSGLFAATIPATMDGDRLFYAANPTSLNVDATVGAFVQEVPIQLPPGRKGLQPSVSLSYSSQNYRDSIVGFGWSISTPYIERINKKGIENLYTRNDFSSSQYGELIETNTLGVYRPRVDNGDFVKFVFAGNTWTAVDKQGTQYKYGTLAGNQLFNPANPALVAKWMLEEVRDTNDNYITYTYQKIDNQIYPSNITYTGHGLTDGIYAVVFSTEIRPDPVFDYSYGFLVKTTQRVKQISVTAGNTPVRSYALGYIPGNNGYRSMLHTVTETYFNEDGSIATTLSPWNFDYTNQAISFTSMTGNMAWEQSRFDQPAYVPTDLDGNGLSDVIISGQYSDGRIFNTRFMGTGNGKFAGGVNIAGSSDIQEIWAYPNNAGYQSSDRGTRLLDINGDMLPDVIKSDVCHTFCGLPNYQDLITKRYYLNDGTGHWGSAITDNTLPTIMDEYPNASTPFVTRAIVGNVNGDIKQDIYPYATSFPWGGIIVPNFAQLIDLNNDGLDDISVSGYQIVKGILNTGGVIPSDLVAGTSFSYPQMVVDADGIDKGIRVIDINNDGLPDIVRAYSFTSWPASLAAGVLAPLETGNVNEIWLNTGSGWVKTQNAPQIPLIANPYTVNGVWAGQEAVTEVFDRDGDGVPDIGLNKTNAPRQDLLRKITLPTGGMIEATFTPTAQQMAGTALNHPKLPMIVWTLASIIKNDGFGNIETTNYTYRDGRVWFDGIAAERKFAGFGTVTETNAGGSTITYYHQANETDAARGEFADSFAKIGKPYRAERYDTLGNLYTTAIYKWDQATTTYGNTFLKLAQRLDLTYDGNATHRDKAETFNYDNATGNLVSKIEWGQVNASGDGTFVDIGNDMHTTNITYATGSSVGVLGARAQEVLTDQSGAKIKETKISYDNLPSGSVDRGNITKQESWRSGASYAAATKSYDSYGNVIQESDPLNNVTSYAYDTTKLFVATTTDPLGHTTSYLYNYSIGKPKQVIDVNGGTFQTIYDGRGRITQELQPDLAAPSMLATKASYSYVDTPLTGSTQKTIYLDGVVTNTSYQYVDGFGRAIQTHTQAETAGTYTTKDIIYNNRGLVEKESLPYFSSGVARTTPTGDITLYTTYGYDALGRVISSTNAVGVTTNTYDDWNVVTTDPNGHRKEYTRDAYGNLVSVIEHNGTGVYTTNYTYDPVGNLAMMVDALGNIRNFTYDGLGKRLSAEDLHSPGDATFGIWSYLYDAAGNLIQRNDPNNQTVLYTYDALNRQLTENYTGHAGVEVAYTYDTCTNGVGRVCSAVMSGVNTGYTYDKIGNIASDIKTIGGSIYTTLYIYDRQGDQSMITYPNNSQVRYTYNTAGLLEKVERKESGGLFTDVVSNIDYSPMSQIVLQADANGVMTTNTYDATKLYRLTKKATQHSVSGNIQDMTYTYDNVGNITRIADLSNTGVAKTVDYAFDELNRLTSAAATSTANKQNYVQTFAYDPIGNLLTKNETINLATTTVYAYTYAGNLGTSYANPHAVTSLNISAISTTTTAVVSTATSTFGINLLVVGGGGGGGKGMSWTSGAGGGGAGGYRYDPAFSVTIGSYPVTVGDGGAGSSSYLSKGNDGGASTFSTIIAVGGGGGGSTNNTSGSNGGSGGGGSGVSIPGYGTVGQGNDGGTGGSGNNRGGGGGGAGAIGGTGGFNGSPYGGNGGDGISNSISGFPVAYAGGGGGSSASVAGAGGIGGGGSGQGYGTYPTPGVVNTGGGGGAASISNGASGGSGVVIIAYPTGALNASGGIIATSSTSTIHTFTASSIFNVATSTNLLILATTTVFTATTTPVDAITLSYDHNGNLLTQTGNNPKTYTWDYNNRIASSTSSGITDTYTYDHTGSRISSQNSTNTTLYVSKLYNILSTGVGTSTTATTTAYTFLTDTPIAITEMVNTATPTIRYLHPDHLGSTNAVTDTAGTILQALDYYPYGQTRMNTGSYTPQRQYIGQYYDTDTSLNYLNARYYDGGRGQFVSEDPVFWEIGLTGDGKNALLNPQSQNSYAYANDNPINGKDPSGRNPALLVPLALFGIGFAAADIFQYVGDVAQNRQSNFSNPYTVSSPLSDYLIGGSSSGVSTAFLSEYKAGASLLAGATSLGQDLYAGRNLDFRKAGTVVAGTYATGSFFAGTAGRSTLPAALSRGESGLSSPGINLGLRYETSQAVFQNSTITTAQVKSSTQNSSQPASNTSTRSSGVGSVIRSIVNSISRLWK